MFGKLSIIIFIFITLLMSSYASAQEKEVHYSYDSILSISANAISSDGHEVFLSVYPYNQIAVYHAPSGIITGKFNIQPPFYKSELHLSEKLNRLLVIGSSDIEIFDRKSLERLHHISTEFGISSYYNETTNELYIMEMNQFRIIDISTFTERIVPHTFSESLYFKTSYDGENIYVKKDEFLHLLTENEGSKKIKIGQFVDFDFDSNHLVFKHLTENYEVSFSIRSLSGELTKAPFSLNDVYGFGKIKAFDANSFLYSNFTQLHQIYADGTKSDYSFAHKIVDYQILPSVGFVIQFEKSFSIMDFEGQQLFSLDARSIMTSANHANENEVVLLSDSLLLQVTSDKIYEKVQLNSLFVNQLSARSDQVVFGTSNGDIMLWDMQKKKFTQTISHKEGCIQLLQLHNKLDQFAVTARNFSSITIYESKSGRRLQELSINNEFVSSLDFKDDFIIAGFSSGKYSVWQKTGSQFKLIKDRISLYQDVVTSVCILTPNALIGSRGRMVEVSLLDTLKDNKVFAGHNSYVNDIQASTDGKYIVSSSMDGSLMLWDYNAERLLETIHLDSGWINSLTLDDSLNVLGYGPGIIAASFDNHRIYEELTNPKPKLTPQVSNSSAGRKLSFSPDGTLLANTDGQKVIVRDVRTGFLISSYVSSTNIVNDITFANDGNSVIVANGRGMDLFDPYTGKRKRAVELKTMNRSIHQVVSFPGTNIYFALNMHGWSPPLAFHMNSNEELYTLGFNLQAEVDQTLLDLTFSDDGKKFATYGNNFIKTFTINPKGVIQNFAFPNPNPGTNNQYWDDLMDFDESGELVTVTVFTSPNTVKVFEVSTGKMIFECYGKLAHFGLGRQLIYMNTNEKLTLVDLDTKEETTFHSNTDHANLICDITHDKQSNVFATTDIWGSQKIWDPTTGTAIVEIERFDSYTYSSRLRDDLKYMMYSTKQGLFLFDYSKLKTTTLPGDNYPFTGVFHPNNELAYIRKGTDILEYNLSDGNTRVIYHFETRKEEPFIIDISPNGDYLICKEGETNKTFILSLITEESEGKVIAPNVKYLYTLNFSSISNAGDMIYFTALTADTVRKEIGLLPVSYSMTNDKWVTLDDIRTFPAIDEYGQFPFKSKLNTRVSEITADGKKHIFLEDYKLCIKDLQNGSIIRSKAFYEIQEGEMANDQKHYILAHENGKITILNLSHGEIAHEFYGSDGQISRISTTENHLIVHALDNTLNLFELGDTIKKTWSTIYPKGTEYIVADESGFYSSSPGAKEAMAFKLGAQIFPFEQFDLYYNRPDFISKKLGFMEPSKIEDLHEAHTKRLEKMGIQEVIDINAIEIPELTITNASSIPFLTNASNVSIQIHAQTESKRLSSLLVWVNNTPIYGQKGIPIRLKKGVTTFDSSLVIELNNGYNKIQISVLNEFGVESYRKQISVKSTKPTTKPNLYFIGIGMREYADTSMNLKYSDKDIRDICEQLSKGDFYENIFIDTFFNEDVSNEIFPSLRKRIAGSNINDHVIVMYSGHGVLDNKLDYYLASYDVDFRNPAQKGILFESINQMLDGIPSRQKLILIDACHSGELDKAELKVDESVKTNVRELETGKGDLFKQLKSTGTSFELMKELFADTRRGTGATIISSSAGKYFSYEDNKYQNGLYTYALREAFDGKADTSLDGFISVTELKNYLYSRVSELSEGRQKPTARQENIDHNFRVF